MTRPTELTDADILTFIANNDIVVLDCWAPWCGPCRMLGPIIDELSNDYKDKIAFGKLNIDNNRSTAEQHGIRSIPTLLIFKNGELIDRIVGALPKEQLRQQLDTYI